MEIKIPAKALRAAQLCVSKDRYRRVLQGVCISWDDEGAWEIAATDSFKLFNAWEWKHRRLTKPTGSVVIDPKDLELKARDFEVTLDTETLLASVLRSDAGERSYALDPIEAPTGYPDVHQLIEDLSDVCAGHTGFVNAEYLETFCKITKIWGMKNRPMQLFTPRSGVEHLEERPMIVKWPGEGPSFHCFGLIMPVRF